MIQAVHTVSELALNIKRQILRYLLKPRTTGVGGSGSRCGLRSVPPYSSAYFRSVLEQHRRVDRRIGICSRQCSKHVSLRRVTRRREVKCRVYFQEINHKTAVSNLKFWTASNDILTDCRYIDPVMRQKQYHSLIQLHLAEFCESKISPVATGSGGLARGVANLIRVAK